MDISRNRDNHHGFLFCKNTHFERLETDFFDGYKKGYNKSLNLYYNKIPKTPTGSIIPLHSFAFLGKTLLNQRFLFLSLVFFCKKEYNILLYPKY